VGPKIRPVRTDRGSQRESVSSEQKTAEERHKERKKKSVTTRQQLIESEKKKLVDKKEERRKSEEKLEGKQKKKEKKRTELPEKKRKREITESKKEKAKKDRKKRKVTVESEDDSDPSSESSSDSSSNQESSESSQSSPESSSSSSESESDSESGKGKKKKRKQKIAKDFDAELLEELWPVEDRPKRLQKKKVVQTMSMSKLLKMQESYTRVQEKKGIGKEVYGKDKKPKSVLFKAKKDDGEKKLHPARFESLPRIEPSRYWKNVPTVREHIYRHLPWQHLGVDMPESTVVKMHNRKVPVELEMMAREVKGMRQVKLGVMNYVGALRSLHPYDYGGFVIQMVLTEAGWGEHLGDSEPVRVKLVKRFFDDCCKENSGHAVRRQPPLSYEQVKTLWLKTVAGLFPHMALVNMGQQMTAMGSGSAANKQGDKL
jgi:hypothetical protein